MSRLVPLFAAAFAVALPLVAAPAPKKSGSVPASIWQDLERHSVTVSYPGSQLKDYVYGRSRAHFAQGDAARDALKNPAEVKQRQEAIRRGVIDGVGGLPSSDTPLNARVTGTVQGDGFTIEKIIFESRPRHYVTTNLYLPKLAAGSRTGAVLFLSGHHATAKHVAEYQMVCQTIARAGLIVFSIDPVGQGERWSYYDAASKRALIQAGTRDHDQAGIQLRFLGEAIARYFIHDAMRAIDYLATRPEVDPSRIGVTGNSGGGTQTSLMMLTDPRIAAAAPATFIMTRDAYQRTGQPQDAEQIWPTFTQRGFDHEDILLAMAPKPVCVLAVKSDFFPIEGTRRTVQRSGRIWELSPSAPKPQLVEDDSTHSYTPTLARAAAKFFARHLNGREVDVSDFVAKPLPPEQLHCTPSGQVRVDLPDGKFIFDETTANAAGLQRARQSVAADERERRAAAWLRTEVNRGRENSPLNPRRLDRGRTAGPYSVDFAFWYSQPHLANSAILLRPKDRKPGAPMPVTMAVWDDGTAGISRHAGWIEAEIARGRAVFVVNLAGMGPLKPDPINAGSLQDLYGTWRKLNDDLDFMGDSLVALRTFEAVRALEVLGEWPDVKRDDVRFYAHGKMGVHARLAAAITPSIKGCEWVNGFKFADFLREPLYVPADVKPYLLPGVLRHFDLDEL